MILKKILSYTAIGALVLTTSCKKDFGTMNVDPTKPSINALKTRFLLANAEQSIDDVAFGISTGNFYVQYISEGPYPGGSLYSTKNFDWAFWYTGALYDLDQIIKEVDANSAQSDESNGARVNQKGVALILQSYMYSFMTERWGCIPFAGALKGFDNLNPAYDNQQAIYNAIFTNLDNAVKMIDESKPGVAGDLLLHGDMLQWKKFANTLRLHMAMNLSKADAAKGQAEFAKALAASGGVISSNSENIEWNYIDDPNYLNPWYVNYTISNRNDYAVSKLLVDKMIADNDLLRLSAYAEKLSGATPYRGLTYGRSVAVNIPGVYSRVGDAFRGKTSPARVFNYPQVLFITAEAIKRGWLPGGDAAAEAAYKEALLQSWEMNSDLTGQSFTQAEFDLFYTSVAYTPANALQLILTQKWVHNFGNGYLAWNDWRRTGYPVLAPAPDAIDSRGIPVRQGYPVAENSLNKESYSAGVSCLGGADDNYTKLWLYK